MGFIGMDSVLTLTLVHILGISFTGTLVRLSSLAAMLLQTYGYSFFAPLVGGALAAVVYKFLTTDSAE